MRPYLMFCCGWLAAAVAGPASGLTLDLDEAVELALRQNRSLVLSALDVRSAEFGIERAKARFDTQVRPVLEYGTLDDREVTTFGIETSRLFPSGAEASVNVSSDDFDTSIGRRARLSIELNQPLFRRFGRLVNEEPIEQATSALRRAQRQFHAQRSDMVMDVIETYETIQRLERQVAADRKSLERADELLSSTRAKESLGRSTRIDILRVQLQRGSAESRLAANREALEFEYQAFAELLGLQPGEDLELTPSEAISIDLPEPAEAVRRALGNRLDYAQAMQDREDRVRGVLLSEKLLLPDIRVTGRYERLDKPFSPTGGDRGRWFFGVRGNTDLNTHTAQLDIERARLEESSAAQRIRVVELAIAREVRQAMLSYRRSRAELGILEANVENARARLELARRLFETGRTDNFSVTDADEAFLDAQTRYLGGATRATLAAYGFLHTLGVLMEFPEALKPGRARP